MKRFAVAAAVMFAIAVAFAVFHWGGGGPAATSREREEFAKRVEDATRKAAVSGPVQPSLARGSDARAYAICFDLAQKPERPKECVVASAFVFASSTCTLDYRGIEGLFHQACALDCVDGCHVLDGLFEGTLSCDAWRAALTAGKTGCIYELRSGIRLGPDDADGAPTQAERDVAHAAIEARKAL